MRLTNSTKLRKQHNVVIIYKYYVTLRHFIFLSQLTLHQNLVVIISSDVAKKIVKF